MLTNKRVLGFAMLVIVIGHSSAFAAADITSNLRVHLDFEATPYVESANALSLSTVGTTTTAGAVGQGIELDGNDDRIYVNNHSLLDFGSSSFTVAYWAKFDSTTGNGGTTVGRFYETPSWDPRWQVAMSTSGQVQVHWSNGSNKDNSMTSVATIGDDQWHHVAVIFDRSINYGRIYINGVEQTYTNSSNGSWSLTAGIDNNNPIQIGRNMHYGGTFYEGGLDDIRIYSRKLSEEDLGALVDMGSAAIPAPLAVFAIPALLLMRRSHR